MSESSNKISRLLSTSSILVICGTVLAVYSQIVAGMIMIACGTIGSIFSFAIEVQRSNGEAEERKALYDNLQKTINSGILLQNTSIDSDATNFH